MLQPRTRKEREVWLACDALWEEGASLKQLTGESIIQRLLSLGYYQGSNSDIYKFKKSWLNTKGLVNTELSATNQSQPLSDPILLAAKKLREEMRAEAQHVIQSIQMGAEEKLNALRFELEKLSTWQQQANEELTKLKKNNQNLLADNDRLEKAFSGECQKRLLAEEKVHLKAAHLAEMRHLMENSLTQSKLAHEQIVIGLKEQLEIKEVEYTKTLSQLITQHEATRHHWMVESDAQKLAQQKMMKQLQALQTESQKISSQNTTLTTLVPLLEKELAEGKVKIASLVETLKNTEKSRSILEGKNQVLQSSLKSSQQQCKELNEFNTRSEIKIAKFELQLKKVHSLEKNNKSTALK